MKKFKKFGKLPGKPSALLKIAMEDLAKVEKKKKKFVVNMGWTWVGPEQDTFMEDGLMKVRETGRCLVCLAGSIIVNRLAADMEGADPSVFPAEEGALEAVNQFRKCEGRNAFNYLDLPRDFGAYFSREIAAYEDDKKAFKRDMKGLIKDLEEWGF